MGIYGTKSLKEIKSKGVSEWKAQKKENKKRNGREAVSWETNKQKKENIKLMVDNFKAQGS